MARRLLLNGPFLPSHAENRMRHEGDVVAARRRFVERRFRNLDALLEQRYAWMNEWLRPDDTIIELGCGAGFSRFYIKHPGLKLTDYVAHDWVDMRVDAMNLPFEPDTVDVFICSHMIHHMASPLTFFARVHPVLRRGGRIVIQEINTCLAMRALLKMLRHEGWSYGIDVFDPDAIANDPVDPWSANCAIPEMLWGSTDEFEKKVPGFRVVFSRASEALLFVLSGGVIAQSPLPIPELPRALLSAARLVDGLLTATMPGLFAMGRSIVLEKRTP